MTATVAMTSTFAERLAYARWLHWLVIRGSNDTVLAERAGVSYEWLAKWKKRQDAPRERLLCKALATYLDVDPAWLFDNEGEAPRPELWMEWIAARRST